MRNEHEDIKSQPAYIVRQHKRQVGASRDETQIAARARHLLKNVVELCVLV